MEPCGLFEEKLSLCIDNVFMSLGKKMNFSVIFSVSNRSVSSSCPAVLPHRKRFTGEQRQELMRQCLCDCFVKVKERVKSEIQMPRINILRWKDERRSCDHFEG